MAALLCDSFQYRRIQRDICIRNRRYLETGHFIKVFHCQCRHECYSFEIFSLDYTTAETYAYSHQTVHLYMYRQRGTQTRRQTCRHVDVLGSNRY